MENELTSALENKNLIFAGSAGTKPSGKHAHIHTPTCTRACVKADIKACEVRVDCWHVRSTQAKPLASLNNATASAWHAARKKKKCHSGQLATSPNNFCASLKCQANRTCLFGWLVGDVGELFWGNDMGSEREMWKECDNDFVTL